jgi:hypothetical protein
LKQGLNENNEEDEKKELDEEEQVDMMVVDPFPKATKLEALQCIDTFTALKRMPGTVCMW